LRANAQKLLRDIQSIHSRMIAQVERVEARIGPAPTGVSRSGYRSDPAPRRAREPIAPGRVGGGDASEEALDVPEFIPPR
jgi:hypothetical protein